MARYVGTSGNDIRAGAVFTTNEFAGFGLGADIVIGGRYDDLFLLRVDKHKDMIDGGLGLHDHLHYGSADRGVTVDLRAGHVWATYYSPGTVTLPPSDLGANGTAGGSFVTMLPYKVTIADITGIEDVTGSKYDDVIKGDNQANILSGGKGNDEVYGAGGNDTLNGGDGKDTLYTGSGRNTVDGGHGDDEVVLQLEHQQSSAYHDHLLGGEGTDTLSFSVTAAFSSFAGVVVFIDREGMPPDPIFGETQTTGLVRSHGANGSITSSRVEAEIDGFENADGTDQDDMLYGSVAAGNRINGFGGNDEISGFSGADILIGGSGRDKFFASDDNVTDEIDGGSGSDTVSYEDTLYESMSHGVLVTLGNNGAAGTTQVVFSTGGGIGPNLESVLEDRLFRIENVIGSDFNDTIKGNNVANRLEGGWGTDKLEGRGGADILDGGRDADTLTGGTEADTFRFANLGDVGSRADTITDFASGTDKIDLAPFWSQAGASHNLNPIDAANLPTPDFVGSGNFSGDGNEIRIVNVDSNTWRVEIDVATEMTNGGGGFVDVEIIVRGSAPTQSDFLF
jgi:Ca2+-binding RTX toxin-like protein